VGALAQLAGEITIVDGRLILTGVDDNGGPTAKFFEPPPPERQAAMLVAAYVPRWAEYEISRDVVAKDFESMLSKMAGQAGLDPSKPFPFVVEGELLDLELHVINGACPMRAKRLGLELPADRQPYRASLAQADGRLVGIYAEGAEHRLTHHGTNTHTHVLLKDKNGQLYTGHVEQVGLRAGSVLRLPVQ
jgi:acetolactate decarboxylase